MLRSFLSIVDMIGISYVTRHMLSEEVKEPSRYSGYGKTWGDLLCCGG